jgi:N-acetylglutamate synthase-like GNAT family acetyltransferase
MSEQNLKIDELAWVRIFDPIHIPLEYVEQIKDRLFTVEKFYQYQREVCIIQKDGHIVLNPTNLLFVLTDKTNRVKGFCWMLVDPLSDALIINTFSMDKEYWGNGKAVQLLEEKAKEIQEKASLKRVFWITRCPKHSEKYGFKRSKHVLMEYCNGTNIYGVSSPTDRNSESNDTGAVEISADADTRINTSVA